MKDRLAIKILLVVIVISFLFGITKLFIMRFEHGDVYPIYSSFRSDPLGTKVFYESLRNIEDISVIRNLESETKLKDISGVTIFYFGINAKSIGFWINPNSPRNAIEDEIKALEKIVSSGGRLVLTLYPEITGPYKSKKEKKDKEKEKKKEENQNKEKHEVYSKSVSLTERWGFDLSFFDNYDPAKKDYKAEKTIAYNYFDIPKAISWHSGIYFDKKDIGWNDVYTLEGMPVVIERKYGKGTIVLSADSYFVSNEALRKERHPELLSWLTGNNKRILFDETHFGIYENPGIASLVRRYSLHGFFAGVIVLSALFIWKNSFSLVPPKQEDTEALSSRPSDGKDYIAGFVSLLKRNINHKELLSYCFQEWKRSFYHKRDGMDEDMNKIQAIIDSDKTIQAKMKNIGDAYIKISKILMERKYR